MLYDPLEETCAVKFDDSGDSVRKVGGRSIIFCRACCARRVTLPSARACRRLSL